MNKYIINPNKAKVISSFLITTIIFVLLSFLLKAVMTSTLEGTHQQYIETCQNISTSYAYAVNNTLNHYKVLLNCFYIPDSYENASPKEIQSTLIKLLAFNRKAAPDFLDVFYVDKKGMGYSQTGKIIDVTDRDYYSAIFDWSNTFFTSTPVRSRLNDNPVIVIAQAIKNQNDVTTGALCASIRLASLSENFNNVELSKIGQLIILDEKGRFIVHPEEAWLYKTFDPGIYGVYNRNTSTLVDMKDGDYETVDVNGEPIRLFCSKVDFANWTLCLKVPLAQENELLHKTEKKIGIIMLCVFAIIIFLVILEYLVLNTFQKHQLIATIYDPLTNIWTRQHFENESNKWVKRNPHSKFMLIDCDIRGFKFVNQNHGEDIANKMLIRFSKILNKYTMQQHGHIGRGFADRFYILVKVPSVHKAMNTFKNIIPLINDEIKKFDLPFFPKYGITFLMPEVKRKSNTIQTLIGQASFAKNTNKDNMMIQYSIYNSRLIKRIVEEQFIEQHMYQALTNNEFFVMYQPKISLETEKIVGAEALVRWNCPELGILQPSKFISLFERNGFITTLDFYVYEQVFKFMEKNISNGIQIVPISVNMSRNHSKPDKFMHHFLEIYKKYNIPASFIQIEILERSFMDSNTLKEITNDLHKEGFTVAMDDFGSGESSLNMLTKIPVDVLKLDRDFLQSSTTETGEIDPKSAGFIEILIKLSKQLNKETVFEGVETRQQKDFLKSIQCDQAQGFFYSKPLTEEEFIDFIKENK